MGLAGAKKRQKISHDPNNTAWARDANGFGQKILSKQGWTPGSYLGARDAAQSSHFTAASASHIRITLKDDTLGIGAKRAGETAENFGLGALVDIYGRLNGKQDSAQFQKEQQARADLGARLFAEQRYGPARFVRGGFLVGDKIEKELATLPNVQATSNLASPEDEHEKPSTKKQKTNEPRSSLEGSPAVLSKAERKEEKRRRKEARKLSRDKVEGETKEERRKRKEERRAHKLAKRAAKAGEQEHSSQTTEDKSTPAPDVVGAAAEPRPALPAARLGGRQAVRQRYIQAKKMAGMNPQALREILMARS